MTMKSILFFIGIIFFTINSFGKLHVKWTKVVPDERFAKVSNFWEIDNYQLLIVEPNNQVYRRKKGDERWELCFSSFTSDFNPNYRFNGQITYGITSFLSINRNFSYYSDNYGKTWNTVNYTFPGFNESNSGYLKDVTVSGYNIFSLYKDTLYLSEDAGLSRRKIFTTNTHFYSINSCKNGNIYAGNWGKVFFSSDTGKTWTLIGDENTGIPGRTIISNVIGVGDSLVYASTEKGLFYTNNNGQSWDTLNSIFSFSQGNMIRGIVSCDSLIYAYTDQSIYLLPPSVDTMKEVNIDFNNKSTIKVFRSIGNRLYLGGYNGLYYSNDLGNTWIIDSIGLQMSCNINCYDYNGEKIVISAYSGYNENNVVLSDNKFNEWDNLFSTYTNTDYVKFAWNNIYAGSIYCSDDDKNPVIYNLPDKSWLNLVGQEHNPLITNKLWVNGDTAFSYASTIERTFNKGSTWDTLSPAMQTNCAFLKMGSKILSIGQFYKVGWKLFISDNYGDDYYFPETTSINGLANVDGEVYALKKDFSSLLISSDTAKTWQSINIDTSYGIEWLYYFNKGVLFAGQGAKYNFQNLLYSLNKGKTWEALLNHKGDSLKISISTQNDLFKHDRIFYLDSGSLYTLKIDDLKTITPVLPAKNALKNNLTINLAENKIKISLTNNLPERIFLYNIKGVLLKTFNKSQFSNNKLNIDCSSYTKGLYFLRIKSQQGTISKKVMIK